MALFVSTRLVSVGFLRLYSRVGLAGAPHHSQCHVLTFFSWHKSKPQCASPFQASACVLFLKILLAKENHMAKLKVKRLRRLQAHIAKLYGIIKSWAK